MAKKIVAIYFPCLPDWVTNCVCTQPGVVPKNGIDCGYPLDSRPKKDRPLAYFASPPAPVAPTKGRRG